MKYIAIVCVISQKFQNVTLIILFFIFPLFLRIKNFQTDFHGSSVLSIGATLWPFFKSCLMLVSFFSCTSPIFFHYSTNNIHPYIALLIRNAIYVLNSCTISHQIISLRKFLVRLSNSLVLSPALLESSI